MLEKIILISLLVPKGFNHMKKKGSLLVVTGSGIASVTPESLIKMMNSQPSEMK